MPIEQENLKHLINMTPLSWGASDEKLRNTLCIGIDNVTVDLSIILGIKKKANDKAWGL
ncbi:MAG: hypothetical protein ACM3TR_07510 [Caulobacteraceae bacterium]